MFSDNLTKLRKFKKLDKAELARIIGISAQAIGQFENGKKEPSLETLKKISAYFGVTIDSLISNENDDSNIEKIKELINRFKYTVKEFALDIGEPVSDIENIIMHNIEPSQKIIDSICDKYGIPLSEFKKSNDDEYKIFCKAEENRSFIEFAMFLKNCGYQPDNVKKLIDAAESIKPKDKKTREVK